MPNTSSKSADTTQQDPNLHSARSRKKIGDGARYRYVDEKGREPNERQIKVDRRQDPEFRQYRRVRIDSCKTESDKKIPNGESSGQRGKTRDEPEGSGSATSQKSHSTLGSMRGIRGTVKEVISTIKDNYKAGAEAAIAKETKARRAQQISHAKPARPAGSPPRTQQQSKPRTKSPTRPVLSINTNCQSQRIVAPPTSRKADLDKPLPTPAPLKPGVDINNRSTKFPAPVTTTTETRQPSKREVLPPHPLNVPPKQHPRFACIICKSEDAISFQETSDKPLCLRCFKRGFHPDGEMNPMQPPPQPSLQGKGSSVKDTNPYRSTGKHRSEALKPIAENRMTQFPTLAMNDEILEDHEYAQTQAQAYQGAKAKGKSPASSLLLNIKFDPTSPIATSMFTREGAFANPPSASISAIQAQKKCEFRSDIEMDFRYGGSNVPPEMVQVGREAALPPAEKVGQGETYTPASWRGKGTDVNAAAAPSPALVGNGNGKGSVKGSSSRRMTAASIWEDDVPEGGYSENENGGRRKVIPPVPPMPVLPPLSDIGRPRTMQKKKQRSEESQMVQRTKRAGKVEDRGEEKERKRMNYSPSIYAELPEEHSPKQEMGFRAVPESHFDDLCPEREPGWWVNGKT